MNILYVITSIEPFTGGPAKAATELCQMLARKGERVTIYCTHNPLNPYMVEECEAKGDGNLKIISFERSWPNMMDYSKELHYMLNRTIADFDVIHIHGVWLFSTYSASRNAFANKVPYVITTAGALGPRSLTKSFFRKKLYFSLIERKTLENATYIQARSNMEKLDIVKLGFDDASIVSTPVGLQMEDYVPRNHKNKFLEKYPFLNNKTVILYLGRIDKIKGLDRLLKSFSHLLRMREDTFLIVAGPAELPDEKKYKKEIEKLVVDLEIQRNIIFTGIVAGDDKLSLLYGSDIFVLPSYYENFGIVVAEAMACSLPVIVSNQTPWEDVQDNGAGYYIDCNVDNLADTLKTLCDNSTLRKSMGERGNALVTKEYALDQIVEKMIKVYDDCLRKKRTYAH